MKARAINVLCIAFVSLVLCGACAHSINGLNLNRLEKSRAGEGPRVDAYFQPLGKKHYAQLNASYPFAAPQEPMPRSHLFFALQKMAANLDAADISLSAPVHVRAASNTIELTFSKNNHETVTVKLPPEADEVLWRYGRGEQITYCQDGTLLIVHNSDLSTNNHGPSFYSSAIAFQMKNDKLAVYTREYQDYPLFLWFMNPVFIPFVIIPMLMPDIQQEGYVYEMISDSR